MRYLNADEEVRIEFDLTKCKYSSAYSRWGKDYSAVHVMQKQGFDKLTIPANSEYVVILDKMSVVERYRILTDGVVFSDLRRQLEFDRTYQTEYTKPHSIWKHSESSLATFELSELTYGSIGTTRGFENYYSFIVLKNYNDEAVAVEIVQEDIEEIEFNTFYEVTLGDNDEEYIYFKFTVVGNASYQMVHNTRFTRPMAFLNNNKYNIGFNKFDRYPAKTELIDGVSYFYDYLYLDIDDGECYYLRIRNVAEFRDEIIRFMITETKG